MSFDYFADPAAAAAAAAVAGFVELAEAAESVAEECAVAVAVEEVLAEIEGAGWAVEELGLLEEWESVAVAVVGS